MKKETLGSRIAWALKRMGSNPNRAAKFIGYNASYIYKVTQDQAGVTGVSLDFGIKMAKYLSVPVEWLYTGKNICEINIVKGADQRKLKDNLNYPLLRRDIPILTWEEIAQFNLKTILDSNKKDRQYIGDLTATGLNNFALIMMGNSMIDQTGTQDSFKDGDILYFDPTVRAFIGCYVLARDIVQNLAYFRRLILDCGRVFLAPHNNSYPVIPVSSNIIIQGVLVDMHRRYPQIFNPTKIAKQIKYLDDLL